MWGPRTEIGVQHGPAQPENTDTTDGAAAADAVQGADSGTEMSSSESLVHALSDGGTGLLFLGGVLIALFIVMRGMRRGSSSRKAQTREMSGGASRIAALHEEAAASTGPARKALLELEESARRFGALLDTKAAKLEVLIDHADERLARLGGAVGEPDAPRKVRSVRPEALDQARVEEDLAARLREPRIEPEPIRIEDAPETPKRVKTTQELVSELADQGLDAKAIAQEIGRPIGQVELMLNIWRNSG